MEAAGDAPAAHVLTADAAGMVCVWRRSDWSCLLRETSAHSGKRVAAIAAHPSGRAALSLGEDGRLVLWDLARMRPIHVTPVIPRGRRRGGASEALGRPEGVSYSRDGGLFLVHGSAGADVFDGTSGQRLARMRASSRCHHAAFFPGPSGGDPWVALACEDGTLAVWADWRKRAATLAGKAAPAPAEEGADSDVDPEDSSLDDDAAEGSDEEAATARRASAAAARRPVAPIIGAPTARVDCGFEGSRTKQVVLLHGLTATPEDARQTPEEAAHAAASAADVGTARIRADDQPLPAALAATGPIVVCASSSGQVSLISFARVAEVVAAELDAGGSSGAKAVDCTGAGVSVGPAMGGAAAEGAVAMLVPDLMLRAAEGSRLTCLAASHAQQDTRKSAGAAARAVRRKPKRARPQDDKAEAAAGAPKRAKGKAKAKAAPKVPATQTNKGKAADKSAPKAAGGSSSSKGAKAGKSSKTSPKPGSGKKQVRFGAKRS